MSRSNAALSLPPGDRDDAPLFQPEQAGEAVAGRDPAMRQPAELASELVRRIAASLDDAASALGFLRVSLETGDLAAAAANAWRLNEALTLVDLRALSIDVRRQIVAAQRACARQAQQEV